MNLQERYLALHALLQPSADLWAHSILERWDPMEAWIPEEWFEFGVSATLEDQYLLGQGKLPSSTPATLSKWVERIQEVNALPKSPAPIAISSGYARGMTPKKRHEVAAILGLIMQEGPRRHRTILDIGGGAGYLARHLSRAYGCPVESVDRNPVLHEEGRRQLTKEPWKSEIPDSVRFITGTFPDDIISARASQEHSGQTLAIGLHTCGDLAWSHLELVRQGASVLNFGCCYEIMDAQSATNRSRFAQEHPIAFTRESLFLANRGGTERSQEEYMFQQRMQQFRFGLHQLLETEGHALLACAVGNASEAHYRGSFAAYVRNRCEHLSIDLGVSDIEIEDFHRSNKPRLERMRFAAFLRNLLSRPVELALLTDRALYAHEIAPAGSPEPQMLEFFDPKISPRNVGITHMREA